MVTENRDEQLEFLNFFCSSVLQPLPLQPHMSQHLTHEDIELLNKEIRIPKLGRSQQIIYNTSIEALGNITSKKHTQMNPIPRCWAASLTFAYVITCSEYTLYPQVCVIFKKVKKLTILFSQNGCLTAHMKYHIHKKYIPTLILRQPEIW